MSSLVHKCSSVEHFANTKAQFSPANDFNLWVHMARFSFIPHGRVSHFCSRPETSSSSAPKKNDHLRRSKKSSPENKRSELDLFDRPPPCKNTRNLLPTAHELTGEGEKVSPFPLFTRWVILSVFSVKCHGVSATRELISSFFLVCVNLHKGRRFIAPIHPRLRRRILILRVSFSSCFDMTTGQKGGRQGPDSFVFPLPCDIPTLPLSSLPIFWGEMLRCAPRHDASGREFASLKIKKLKYSCNNRGYLRNSF